MTLAEADPRAVAVAQAVHQRERPQATILFGSRARGDYNEKYSDIDLLLVCDVFPDDDTLRQRRTLSAPPSGPITTDMSPSNWSSLPQLF